MNIPFATTLCLATALLMAVNTADAQSIYKCSKAGQVEYTDHPCVGAKGELLHQASDREIIDQYLDLGQDTLAERYASARHLEGLYKARLAAHQQKMQDAAARQQQDQAVAAQQRAEQAQQQLLANETAHRNQLQAQNNLLREQNEQYRDQLTQPVESPSLYWGASPRYGREHHGHDDKNHRPPPVSDRPAVFQPCTQMAGGRVKC